MLSMFFNFDSDDEESGFSIGTNRDARGEDRSNPIRVGQFGCSCCGRRWYSAHAKNGEFQKCKSCLHKCYVASFKTILPNKRAEVLETAIGHNQALTRLLTHTLISY
jgi:hypothetical protein